MPNILSQTSLPSDTLDDGLLPVALEDPNNPGTPLPYRFTRSEAQAWIIVANALITILDNFSDDEKMAIRDALDIVMNETVAVAVDGVWTPTISDIGANETVIIQNIAKYQQLGNTVLFEFTFRATNSETWTLMETNFSLPVAGDIVENSMSGMAVGYGGNTEKEVIRLEIGSDITRIGDVLTETDAKSITHDGTNLFVVGDFLKVLITVNPDTGATIVSNVAEFGLNEAGPVGINYETSLYMYGNSTDRIIRLDYSGDGTLAGPSFGSASVADMVVLDAVFYVIRTNGQVWRWSEGPSVVNVINLSLTPIFETSVRAIVTDGMNFFVIGDDTDRLIKIEDVAGTPSASFLGGSGFGVGFANAKALIYAGTHLYVGAGGRVARIDPATGAGTLIGTDGLDMDVTDIVDFAWDGSSLYVLDVGGNQIIKLAGTRTVVDLEGPQYTTAVGQVIASDDDDIRVAFEKLERNNSDALIQVVGSYRLDPPSN